MTITTRDGLVNATANAAQHVEHSRQAARTTVAGVWFSLFDIAGQPGAGTLAGTSTAAGVVPDDTTAGCPAINAFGVGATGYLTKVEHSSSVAGVAMLADMLWKGGAYAFNASVTLSAQPSYSARVPGADYKGLQIWFEGVTAFTGNPTITITYTNDTGVTGRSTGAIAFGLAPIVGRMFKFPLQAGDGGVQKIESVTSTVATVGTFNVLVLRPLEVVRARTINDLQSKGPDLTGMPIVFATSAFVVVIKTDGAASGVPETRFSVVNG